MKRLETRRRTLLSLANEYKYGEAPKLGETPTPSTAESINEPRPAAATSRNTKYDTHLAFTDFERGSQISSIPGLPSVVVNDPGTSQVNMLGDRVDSVIKESRRITKKSESVNEPTSFRGRPSSKEFAINNPILNENHSDLGSINEDASEDGTIDEDVVETVMLPKQLPVSYSSLPEEGHVPGYRAVFLISNAALGAGLLNYPEAFMKAGGVQVALTTQLFLLIPIIGSFLILARCANLSKAATYQDIILHMCGKKFKALVQIMIAVYFFGSAITYIIIIGEQLSSVLVLITGAHHWYTDKKFLFTVYALVFLFPLCVFRRLKALSYTSFFGGIGAMFITAVIVHNYFNGEYAPNPWDPEIVTDWKTSFAALPVICFGFQCHVSSVVVYAELKNRSKGKFLLCAGCAMVICTLTYALCGTFGYKTFGKSTKADILENYSDSDMLINIARISIIFILLSSFAIVSFCARTVIDGLIISFKGYDAEHAEETERVRRLTITIIWFIGVLSLAALVPNIGVAIAMIGGIAGMFIFTFPGLCLFQSVNYTKSRLTRNEKLLLLVAALYMMLGMFIFGEVTTLAINRNIVARHIL